MDLQHPEHLLDHGQLIRSLATALVRGAADVDDVVQGTYTAALGSTRPAGFPLPRWLLGITRNVARRWHRDQRRRSARELAVAKPEALCSTAEVLEFEELRRLVVAAVLELPDPQRSVVLLRYYEGLPPRAIAAQLRSSVAAVRSHLHRGLATLRQRLDRTVRGGRAAWTALLLPLSPVPAPGAAVATALKFAVPIAIAGAVALHLAMMSDPTLPEAHGATAMAAVGARSEPSVVVADAAPRVLVSDSLGAAAEAAEPAVAPLATLRFLDHAGQPLAGPELRERFAATRTEPTVLLLDVATLERSGIEGMVATLLGIWPLGNGLARGVNSALGPRGPAGMPVFAYFGLRAEVISHAALAAPAWLGSSPHLLGAGVLDATGNALFPIAIPNLPWVRDVRLFFQVYGADAQGQVQATPPIASLVQ